jgi:Protein of unknown function (DUF2786)
LPPELLAEELLGSARARKAGHGTAAVLAERPRAAGTAAAMALARVIHNLWHGGWMPADAWEIVRRRADGAAVSLLVDAIAADAAQYAPALVDERWAAQIGRLDAVVWWDRDRPHLGQWASRHELSFERALVVTIMLLAELMALPALPQILPPPGTAPTRPATARAAGVDQKILARVRALLAKAESTQFPEEAEALSAKA